MPEPMDTIRRVNSDEPMTLEELYRARAVLDAHSGRGALDVREARRRVGAMITAAEPPRPAGAEPPRPIAAPNADAATKEGKKALAGAMFILVLGVALLGGCVAWLANRGDSSSSSGGDGRDEFGAQVMCEQFVEDRLKAPATADFPSSSEYVVSGSGNSYTVQGYVDAENSFGAKIRTNFVCEVRDNGDDTWNLVSLSGL